MNNFKQIETTQLIIIFTMFYWIVFIYWRLILSIFDLIST